MKTIQDMKQCQQSEKQSVWEHGLSVQNYTNILIKYLHDSKYSNYTGQIEGNWKLPNWIINNRRNFDELRWSKYYQYLIQNYTLFHDLGKPYCLAVDENGKRHFPNHAEVSYQKWMEIDGDPDIGELIRMDMKFHTMKADEVEEFANHPLVLILMVVGLSEIHSNAELFGGIDSDSFKIKWKKLDKMGEKICNLLFGEDK